jgi:hypothetical protein
MEIFCIGLSVLEEHEVRKKMYFPRLGQGLLSLRIQMLRVTHIGFFQIPT